METIVAIATIVGTIAALVGIYYARKQATSGANKNVGDDEFQESLRKHQVEFSKIVPEGNKYKVWSNGKCRFEIINGSIADASSEIIVSSDDNVFSASGGVAKAILTKAGRNVALDLDVLRRFRWRHGAVAVTRAGKFPSRYIAHPVVIDHKRNLYPDQELVKEITRRCLNFADTVDADSISLPVFGGGTASRNLTAAQSVQSIADSVVSYMGSASSEIEYVALYVFDKNDIPPSLIGK